MTGDTAGDTRSTQLLTSLTAGFVAGILTIIMVTAFGAMIFSGPLAPYVSKGIGLILFGAFALGMVVSLTGSFAGTVARPHEIPAAILALVAAAIAGGTSGALVTAEETYITVVATMMLTSLCTGAFFLLLGLFKMGDLIRFIPYPVIGGFLAGTGLLLVKGAVGAMTDKALTLAHLPYLLQTGILLQWLPGLALGLLIFLVLRRHTHILIMPAMLLAATAVFYGVLLLTGTSLADARAQGWLLKAFEGGTGWEPLSLQSLGKVNWSLMASQAGKGATILIISAMSLLLNASGLELLVRQEIDLNRELKSVGIANLVGGLFGGPVGIHSLSLSALGYRMGANSRVIGIFAALVCGATLLFGTSILSFFPRPIIGSLLLFLGFTFLYEWVYDAWFKLSRTDYILVVVILAVIGGFGFLEGVATGMFVAVILFVVKYSRINVVKHVLSGTDYHSNVDRAALQRRLLREKGGELYILKLQGYIFFGTANRLLEQVRQRATDTDLAPLSFVVFDFHLVNSLDSSAVHSFLKLKQFADAKQFGLIFTNLPGELAVKFERAGFRLEGDRVFHAFPDLDHGVEWCENRLLIREGLLPGGDGGQLHSQIEDIFSDPEERARFMAYLVREDVGQGYFLMHQGDPPKALYFIHSGQVTVELKGKDGKTVRLRTMGAGTVVGELGIYLGFPATASVITEGPTTILRLSVENMKSMEETDPAISTAFHKYVIRLIGERLAYTNKTVQALLD